MHSDETVMMEKAVGNPRFLCPLLRKESVSKKENEIELEIELKIELETEIERECVIRARDTQMRILFAVFWMVCERGLAGATGPSAPLHSAQGDRENLKAGFSECHSERNEGEESGSFGGKPLA